MQNWQYLVSAYTIAWLGVAYYVFINARKQQVVEQKIADLEDKFRDS